MVRVKVCGITNLADARAAVEAGADALGFVFAPSPRRVDPVTARGIMAALPPMIVGVGVFLNQAPNLVAGIRSYCGLDLVQFHGDEDRHQVADWGRRAIKALAAGNGRDLDLEDYPGATLLLDADVPGGARGGTGQVCDWDTAARAARNRPVILAGGLNPDNVQAAVAAVRPFGVDASSGLEIEPGRKDHAKIAEFVARAKAA